MHNHQFLRILAVGVKDVPMPEKNPSKQDIDPHQVSGS